MTSVQNVALHHWLPALQRALSREHHIDCRVQRIVRSARVLVYALLLNASTDLRKLANPRTEEALALALGVDSVRIARSRGVVNVEVLLPEEHHTTLTVDALQVKGRLWFTAGQTSLGQPVHVNLGGSRYPHALVAATTGAGKTYLLRLLLWELITHNTPEAVQIVLIDGKGGGDYTEFEHTPHLIYKAGTPDASLQALAWALVEMDRRKSNHKIRPTTFVVIDEMRELLSQTGGSNGLAASAIQSLASIGRGLGMHVIAATQHPRSDVLGGKIAAANLPLRLVGRVVDASAAALATGQKESGAQRLYGKGDFLAVDGDVAHRLQVATLTPQALAKLPQGSTPGIALETYDLAQVLNVAGGTQDNFPEIPTPDRVAWAIINQTERQLAHPSASAIRGHFGGSTTAARQIRDYADCLMITLKKQGYSLLPYSNSIKMPV